MPSPVITRILTNLAVHIPIYLVWLAGFIVALLTWRRHPRPSLYAILGIGSMFAFDLIGIYIIPVLMRPGEGSFSYARIAMFMSIVGVVMAILRSISWGLLLAAIFIGRDKQTAPAGQ